MPDPDQNILNIPASWFDSIAALVILNDLDGNVIQFNRACQELSGYSFEEIKHQEIWSRLLLPEEVEGVRDVFARQMSGETPVRHENHWVTKNGDLVWIEWSNATLLDENGKVAYILSTGLDMTDKYLTIEHSRLGAVQRTRQLEAALLEKISLQNKLVELQQASPVVIFSAIPDDPYLITYISENVERIYGFKSQKILTNPRFWEDWVHPVDVMQQSTQIENYKKSGSFSGELRLRTTTGHYLQTWMNIQQRKDENGKVIELLGSVRDITEQRIFEAAIQKSEERYRTLAEAASDFIFVITLKGQIDYVNRYGAALFHLLPEDMLGKRWDIFLPVKSVEELTNRLKNLTGQNAVLDFDEFLELPDRDIWLGIRLVPIWSDGEHLTAILGIARDISQIKQAEIQLQKALQQEKDLNALRYDFISLITHQFGTPLSTILSSTELLEHYGEQWSADRRKIHLERIKEATNRLNRMVREIMELRRIETGQKTYNPVELDLAWFMKKYIEEVEQRDQRKHVLVFSHPASMEPCLMDERLLYEVVDNLISNALKYSPKQSEIKIALWRAQDQIFFEVCDQGMGIPAGDIDKLGTAFYRSSNVTRIPGTGLGMTLVRHALQAMGGDWQIQSQEGSGTCVKVWMPFRGVKVVHEQGEGENLYD